MYTSIIGQQITCLLGDRVRRFRCPHSFEYMTAQYGIHDTFIPRRSKRTNVYEHILVFLRSGRFFDVDLNKYK